MTLNLLTEKVHLRSGFHKDSAVSMYCHTVHTFSGGLWIKAKGHPAKMLINGCGNIQMDF